VAVVDARCAMVAAAIPRTINHGKEFRIPGNDYQLLYFIIEN